MSDTARGVPRGRRVALPGRGTTLIRDVAGPPGAPTVVLLHGLGRDRVDQLAGSVRRARAVVPSRRPRSGRPRRRRQIAVAVPARGLRRRRRPPGGRARDRARRHRRVLDGRTGRPPRTAPPSVARERSRAVRDSGAVRGQRRSPVSARRSTRRRAAVDAAGGASRGEPDDAAPRERATRHCHRRCSTRSAATTPRRSSRPCGRWAASTPGHGSPSWRCPAVSVITARDRLVPPSRQLELAAATGARVVRIDADHLGAVGDRARFLPALASACRYVAAAVDMGATG